jgi:Protein of unknown function (DUF938)
MEKCMTWKMGTPDARLDAPATERNREPILSVLKTILPPKGQVLEIASGTGQHLTFFAPHFPELTWQPSDPDPMHLASIESWIEQRPSANILSPIQLDVTSDDWEINYADVMLCINMIHIAPLEACLGLFRGAQSILPNGGLLYLYGPFKQQGQHTAPSNEDFDFSLRAQDPSWGVRDLEEVVDTAQKYDLHLQNVIPMPANNFSVVFCRRLKDD